MLLDSKVRVVGVNLNPQKIFMNELRKKVFGLGPFRSKEVCKMSGITENTRVKDITDTQLSNFFKSVEDLGYEIGTALVRSVLSDIRRLTSIRCYRARRKEKGLPCRGQRTSSNCRTAKKGIVPKL